MDDKLEEIRQEQKTDIQNIEERLTKQIDKKIDSKADRISVEVANHVVERLMELMQPQQVNNLQPGQTNQSTITQDGISSPQDSKIHWKGSKSTQEQVQSLTIGDNKATMLTAIKEITLSHEQNFPHDALKGKVTNTR